MRPPFIIVTKDGAGFDRVYQPATRVTSVGRSEQSLMRLDHPGVSRIHAQIDHSTTVWTLRDLQSRNGTFVNDCLMRESPVRNGDIIAIGPFHLQICLPQEIRIASAEADELTESTHEEAAPVPKSSAGNRSLTPQELRVLAELLLGRSKKEIAQALGRTENTIHGHVTAIYRFFDASSHPELLAKCL